MEGHVKLSYKTGQKCGEGVVCACACLGISLPNR